MLLANSLRGHFQGLIIKDFWFKWRGEFKRTVISLSHYYHQIPGQMGVSWVVKNAISPFLFTFKECGVWNRGVKQIVTVIYKYTGTRGKNDVLTLLLELMAPNKEHCMVGSADLVEGDWHCFWQRESIAHCRVDPSYSRNYVEKRGFEPDSVTATRHCPERCCSSFFSFYAFNLNPIATFETSTTAFPLNYWAF